MLCMDRLYKIQGLTLVELIVTMFVLSVTLSSVLMFFTNARLAQQYAKDSTVAVSHAEHMMEEMRARTTLANITATNWPSWASSQNLNTLPSESMTIAYTNSASDPLEITVSVNWARNARSFAYSLLTRMTK